MPALHLHKSLAGENNPYLHFICKSVFEARRSSLFNSIANNSDLSISTIKLFQSIIIAALCTILRSRHILYAIKILRKSELFYAENRLHAQSVIPAPPRARTRQRAAETAEIKRAWSGTWTAGRTFNIVGATKNAFCPVQRGKMTLQTTITAR